VAVDVLHLPLGFLECHLLSLVLLGSHLLFSLPLARRRAFLVRLLLLLAELFHELLDLLALTRTVAHGVLYRASGTAVIAVGCLIGALVTSWASASTCHCSSSYGSGGTGQRLVVTVSFLLIVVLVVVVVVAAALGVELATILCP
jgi:hypothetical protein